MGWKGIERNRLDYILTDLLPVEVSELLSFSQFYSFLLNKDNQKELNGIVKELKMKKALGKSILVSSWSTKPLKYRILKGNNSTREMSIIQPVSALNVYFFIECYQKDILDYFEKNHLFSIRYHKKNTDLHYKSKSGKVTHYFQRQAHSVGRDAIQQTATYFKIAPFESINSFSESREWRMCNFKYKYYAKLDYKACFDSIYTHAFTWIIERNTIDAKKSKEHPHLFPAIDRILQNINGRSSNGVVVGPEFSRMIAEILLQHIDRKVFLSLEKGGIKRNVDYSAYRYVDDIFLFANRPQVLDEIISKYNTIGEEYLLRINELKLQKDTTPCLPKEWLEKTRRISDIISDSFYHGNITKFNQLPEEERFLIKPDFFPVDRLKDEIAILIKHHHEDRRTIVSFLLSTLLNNISKKKDGYTLFGNKPLNKALLLVDFALYIYAFYPSFDQTRKVISIISYINNEIDFKSEENANRKLNQTINRYSFIFQSGNIFDLCDWLPFLSEYKIYLNTKAESALIRAAEASNNPIIWGNLLMYSKYNKVFSKEMLDKVEEIVHKQLSKISNHQPMMQEEFWYVLIFHNCPYISEELKSKMSKMIQEIELDNSKGTPAPSNKATMLVCKFLERRLSNGDKPLESFFNWKGIKNFSDHITYRTYQRTIFKPYHNKKHYLYVSID